MSFTFRAASAFNQNIGSWNTVQVANMQSTFAGASGFNRNIASWNVLRVTTFQSAFDSTTALEDCHKQSMYGAWGSTLKTTNPTWSLLCTPSPTSRYVRVQSGCDFTWSKR
jgi:hypothetical protein